jgi:hypothetical protein
LASHLHENTVFNHRKRSLVKTPAKVEISENAGYVLLCQRGETEDSDWLAWIYPSPYTAAYRFGIVMEWRGHAASGRAHGTYEIDKCEWESMERK